MTGDAGKFEKNQLCRYFLRRFGPRHGPMAYFPLELALVIALPAAAYNLVPLIAMPVEAQTVRTVLGDSMLVSLAASFVYVIIHNIRGTDRMNRALAESRRIL